MSVIDDVQSRISSIQQMFPALLPTGDASTDASGSTSPSASGSTTATSGTGTSTTGSSSGSSADTTAGATTFGSELASAMAATATADEPDNATADSANGAPVALTSSGVGSTTGAGSSAPGSSTDLGSAVVADAQRYLGVPYVFGGTNPATGLDCSALVQRAYGDLGVTLPRTSQQQSTVGVAVPSLAEAQPGDLVCFGSPATHIGIYVGDGKMIDAPHTGTSVQIQEITRTPSTIRRIAGTSLVPAVAPPDASDGVIATSAASALAPTDAIAGTTSSADADAATALLSRPTALGGLGGAVYAARFSAAETKYDLPTGLLSAVAHAESNYNPTAVSDAGAIGLMQLMPATASALGVDPTDPTQAIDGAARLLSGELQKYGSIPLALAAYNAGGPAVDQSGGIPPYPQTQNYVQKVMAYMSEDA